MQALPIVGVAQYHRFVLSGFRPAKAVSKCASSRC